jgi:hypothetical protein
MDAPASQSPRRWSSGLPGWISMKSEIVALRRSGWRRSVYRVHGFTSMPCGRKKTFTAHSQSSSSVSAGSTSSITSSRICAVSM